MANLHPHQKATLHALGVYEPQPTNKRAKVKAARKANIRRMQIERSRGKPGKRPDPWLRLGTVFRKMGLSARNAARSFRKLGRHVENYHFGGTITGRFLREPSFVERLAENRTKPFADRGKVVVVSTPLLDTDYSEIERRVLAQIRDKFEVHADVMARNAMETPDE